MRFLTIALLFVLLTGSVRAEMSEPEPTPEPPPTDTTGTPPGLGPSGDPAMPAGDPSVTLTLPTPEPTPAPTPKPQPPLEAGPAELSVRVCIDLDGDHQCGVSEGIYGVPVVIFDASTGATLAGGKTNEAGTFRAPVHITDRMDLAAAAPALGLSSQVWDTQRGVVLLLGDVPIFPVGLP